MSRSLAPNPPLNHHNTTNTTAGTDLSHTRTVQAAMIHREMLKTSSTVPGQMVMRVFMTKRVLKCTCRRKNTDTHSGFLVHPAASHALINLAARRCEKLRSL